MFAISIHKETTPTMPHTFKACLFEKSYIMV